MNARALKSQLEATNIELLQAAEDLFLRRRYGHLDSFCYSTPAYPTDPVRGASIWSRLLQHNKHYNIPVKEAALIATAAPELRNLPGKFDQFIDFGPGSVEAFNAKTRPFLNNLNIDMYRPIDICEDFLSEIAIVMKLTNPGMKIQAERSDFLAEVVDPAKKPSWLFWGGSGFANIPTTDTEGLPIDGLRTRLAHTREFLCEGSHCIITLDTMNDQQSLMQAYGHPLVVLFLTNLLHQIKRDCPEISLDPTGWTYRPVWREERCLVEHHIVAMRAHKIELPSQTVHVEAGESFIAEHSFKLQPTLVAEIAKSVGWSHTMTLGQDGQVQLLILST